VRGHSILEVGKWICEGIDIDMMWNEKWKKRAPLATNYK